ncbi:hypothetical protein M1N66_01905 [Thermodesulfovibrionales bacterium]|nr:hypothetical protein [Thermodesulfovibrionales bacterium]
MTRVQNHSQIHLRVLTLYTDKPFQGHGSDLRRAITAQFKDNPVLHNHNGIGFDYQSPRVRYIVTKHLPRLLSFESGLDVVEQIYKEKPRLKVGYTVYAVTGTELEDRIEDIGIFERVMYKYSSITPWLALNEKNYSAFMKIDSLQKRKAFLSKILVGNLLSLSKNLNLEIRDKVRVTLSKFTEVDLKAGQIPMLGFKVNFETNYKISSLIGIGKLVSKGFGIMKMRA